jgi:hypothetical protein
LGLLSLKKVVAVIVEVAAVSMDFVQLVFVAVDSDPGKVQCTGDL